MVATALLAHLIAGCAPRVGRRTMSSIVAVESGGDPLAIHDNTSNGRGHSVDLGLAQINSANLPSLGLSVRAMFDPCTNVRAGATILSAAYRQAQAHFGPGQFALRRAIGAYNTGSLTHGDHYIAAVVAAAGVDFGARRIAFVQGVAPHGLANIFALQRFAESTGLHGVAQRARIRASTGPPPAKHSTKPNTSPNDAPVVVTVTSVPVAVVSNGAPNF
jgi:type IV secretion system protein VirB1